jgi:hypothetical protein
MGLDGGCLSGRVDECVCFPVYCLVRSIWVAVCRSPLLPLNSDQWNCTKSQLESIPSSEPITTGHPRPRIQRTQDKEWKNRRKRWQGGLVRVDQARGGAAEKWGAVGDLSIYIGELLVP